MNLMLGCLHNSPARRPEAVEILTQVSRVAAQFPSSSKNKVELLQQLTSLRERPLQQANRFVCQLCACQFFFCFLVDCRDFRGAHMIALNRKQVALPHAHTHTHTHTHTHKHTSCIHMHTHTHKHTSCIHTYTHTSIPHVYTCTHTHTHTHTHTEAAIVDPQDDS